MNKWRRSGSKLDVLPMTGLDHFLKELIQSDNLLTVPVLQLSIAIVVYLNLLLALLELLLARTSIKQTREVQLRGPIKDAPVREAIRNTQYTQQEDTC